MRRRVCHFSAAVFSLGLSAAAAYALQIRLYPYTVDAEGKLEFLEVERVEKASPRQDPQAKLGLRLGSDLDEGYVRVRLLF